MTGSRDALNIRYVPACTLDRKVLYLLLTPLIEPVSKEPVVAVDIRVMCTKSCRAMGIMFCAMVCESNTITDTGTKVSSVKLYVGFMDEPSCLGCMSITLLKRELNT